MMVNDGYQRVSISSTQRAQQRPTQHATPSTSGAVEGVQRQAPARPWDKVSSGYRSYPVVI